MAAQVIIVHDDPAVLEAARAALTAGGCEVRAFADPMLALDALDQQGAVDLLITRFVFPAGKPNGVALGRMVRLARPSAHILFIGRPENARHADGIGLFLAFPLPPAMLLATVRRILGLRTQPLRMASAGVRRSAPLPPAPPGNLSMPGPAPSALLGLPATPSGTPPLRCEVLTPPLRGDVLERRFSWRSRFLLAAVRRLALESEVRKAAVRASVARAVQSRRLSRRLRGCPV